MRECATICRIATISDSCMLDESGRSRPTYGVGHVVIATINARTTYDGMSISDITTVARLIDVNVREYRFAENGESYIRFHFPDGSVTVYADSDD